MTATRRTTREGLGSQALRCCAPIGRLGLVLALCAATASAAEGWAVAKADARVPLSVEGDLYSRGKAELEVTLDFNALLGARRVLCADSLSLLDAATGETVALDVAQDAQMRYASGNPILRLRWASGPLAPFARRAWHLYVRTVEPDGEGAWSPLEATFVPRPADVLLETSFETADPTHPDRPEFMSQGGRDAKGETSERVWTDEDAHTGKRSLKIARTFESEPPSNSNRPFWWTWPPPMSVRPGQAVRVSAWLKATRLDPGSVASMMLEFRDPVRGRLREGMLRLTGHQVPHGWTRVSSSTTAPAGATSAVLWFSLHGGGHAYCDDVTVTTIPGGELPRLNVAAGPVETRAAFAPGPRERTEGKVLACGIAPQPPTLDGILDDPCWKTAGRIDDFKAHAQVPGTSVTTAVLVCADREALYFGFECAEPNTADLRAAATERDGKLWEDDSVELFLDTNLDLHTYYQIIVNSRGAIFDQDTGMQGLDGPKWNGPVIAAGRVQPGRWTAEVKLEFAGLRLAEAEGRVWGANFARSSFRGGRSLYVWSPVKKNFGEPQHFGRLVLPFDPSANVVAGKPLAKDRVFWGDGALPFEVANRREAAAAVRVTATEQAAAGDRALGAATATVAPRSAGTLLVPAKFLTPGEARVRYELSDTQSGKVLYRTSVTHVVPEPLTIEPAALVSYLGESQLRGAWSLGLADLTDVKLAFTLVSAGADAPIATGEVIPKAATGCYALDVSGLRAGRHELRVRLLRGGHPLAEASYHFDRIAGPFSPPPRNG